MSAEGLIGSIIVLGLTAVLLGFPFLGRKTIQSQSQNQLMKQRDELLTTYERVVASIRDLDDDHLTGKLDNETYNRERDMWSERGVQVLAELDELGMDAPAIKAQRKAARKNAAVANGQSAAQKPAAQPATAEAELDDAIEAAISRYADSLKAKQN